MSNALIIVENLSKRYLIGHASDGVSDTTTRHSAPSSVGRLAIFARTKQLVSFSGNRSLRVMRSRNFERVLNTNWYERCFCSLSTTPNGANLKDRSFRSLLSRQVHLQILPLWLGVGCGIREFFGGALAAGYDVSGIELDRCTICSGSSRASAKFHCRNLSSIIGVRCSTWYPYSRYVSIRQRPFCRSDSKVMCMP